MSPWWSFLRLLFRCPVFNSLKPSDAYMHQQTKPPLIQIMARHLFSAKPLSEPMLIYCQLVPSEINFSETSMEIKTFSFKKMHLKMLSGKWRSFCLTLKLVKSSHCNSFEVWTPINFICRFLVFRWIAKTSLTYRVPGWQPQQWLPVDMLHYTCTVKPVCKDHLYNKICYLRFIQ